MKELPNSKELIPHLPEVPHLHVNRPYLEFNYQAVENGSKQRENKSS